MAILNVLIVFSIYLSGGQPQLMKLYTKVTFPVSRGTPFISPLVSWDHSSSWSTPAIRSLESYGGTITVNLSKPEYSDLRGIRVHGMMSMPGAAYVVSWILLLSNNHNKTENRILSLWYGKY